MLSKAITGKAPLPTTCDDLVSDLVLIGSDAVNLEVHHLIKSRRISSLGIRTGTDDYRIVSLNDNGRQILILAGGRKRADYYAVYDYFERYCSCRWFWDGDILPQRDELPLENIDHLQQFRFRYRGLRYFAHRSLHRFQAEHWSVPEWERELHYLLKKRFNLFMLRIGSDDQFQQAFPESVPYPPEDAQDPDAISRSYNDRTCFWGLKERGRIRSQIIAMAHKLDLCHPVDMGPMTHWYSRTPAAFLKTHQPVLQAQSTDDYNEQSGQTWELTNEENLANYWKLTQAELRRGERPELFHIIGLAERRFGDAEENLQLKLYAYRRFIRLLRNDYPNAVLLIASWDLMIQWNVDDVRQLLQELDPENTIILDYTQDLQCRPNDFVQWGLPHRFPYIFGIFQGVVRYSGTAFDFAYTERNFQQTLNDSFCKGMVMWSEMSHANTLLHEYLAKRSAGDSFSLHEFCRDRYGCEAESMEKVWKTLEKEFAANSFHQTGLVFDDTFNLLNHLAKMPQDHCESAMREEFRKLQEMRPHLPGVYAALADITARTSDEMVLRDIIDIARTHLMSDLVCELGSVMGRLWTWRKDNGEKPSADRFVKLTEYLAKLLETSDEYSLCHSLELLAQVHPLNPASEQTLMGNAENSYCRTYIAELARAIYIPEAKFLRDWIASAQKEDRADSQMLLDAEAAIRDKFYAHPLAAHKVQGEPLSCVLNELENI
ncbi:MAG: hypothetical protein GX946_03395 [Oligosphaeraceae bacterium]|nr:hypothetical protein [Oligosphaeraceae bacterium]